jgi:hypothetical protein
MPHNMAPSSTLALANPRRPAGRGRARAVVPDVYRYGPRFAHSHFSPNRLFTFSSAIGGGEALARLSLNLPHDPFDLFRVCRSWIVDE